MLNGASMKFFFQTGIGAADHATLVMEQLFCMRTDVMDTITSLQDTYWEVVQFQKCMTYVL